MLSIYLIPFVRAFIFQIVNQNSKIADGLKSVGGVYYATNGWKITSAEAPEINIASKTIYLRGRDKEQDLRPHRCWDISSNLKRDQYMAEIDSALNEFANYCNNVPKVDVGIDWTTLPVNTPMAGGNNTSHKNKVTVKA